MVAGTVPARARVSTRAGSACSTKQAREATRRAATPSASGSAGTRTADSGGTHGTDNKGGQHQEDNEKGHGLPRPESRRNTPPVADGRNVASGKASIGLGHAASMPGSIGSDGSSTLTVLRRHPRDLGRRILPTAISITFEI